MARFEGERLFSDYLDGETGWGGLFVQSHTGSRSGTHTQVSFYHHMKFWENRFELSYKQTVRQMAILLRREY